MFVQSARMCRLSVVVLPFLYLILQSHADGTARDEGSPQFIYMERLRLLTHGKEVIGPAIEGTEEAPGTLLATSFKDNNTMGGRFDVDTNSGAVNLHFTVPQQQDSSDIVKSELWLFPSLQAALPNEWYTVRFLLTSTLPSFNRPIETLSEVKWKSSGGCVMVDATVLTKKIARKLKNYKLNETLVYLKVQILSLTPLYNEPKEADWQDICKSLSPRSSNGSFLVVKYYSDQVSSTTSERKKRNALSGNDRSPEDEHGCSLVPFNVNLTEIYGTWVVSPIGLTDIGDCAGDCDVVSNYNLFSSRALLKDRLRDHPTHDVQPVTCVPVAFNPLVFLIYQIDYYVLVEYHVKATKCGCR